MKTLVSFPKSGRTWIRYACAVAGVELKFTHAGHPTHLQELCKPWVGIPPELEHEPVIFMHRNPLDTCVSLYHQLLHKDLIPNRKTWRWMEERNKPLPPLDINKFVTHKHYGIRLICQFNRGWLKHIQNVDGAYVLSYERLKAEPDRTFNELFKVMGHPKVNGTHIARDTTFIKMRNIQNSGQGDIWRMRKSVKGNEESAKVRKGKVRGYVDYLTPDTIDTCRRIAAKYKFEI